MPPTPYRYLENPEIRFSISYYLTDMNVYPQNILICNFVQYIYVTGLCNFCLCSSRFDWQNKLENSFSEEHASNWLLTLYIISFFQWKKAAFTGMALHKLVGSNYDRKLLVSIKHENLHSFKKGWFPYVRVSLKQEEYHIYPAQLSLQFLRCWIPNPGVPCSKPLGGSKVHWAVHLSVVNQMSTRN